MIKQVKEFNREAKQRYDKAVDKHEVREGGFPFLPMYLFMTEDNKNERVKGWVRVKPNSYHWYKNKQLAMDNDINDTRKCHLCNSVLENKYCTNESCAEFE